MYIDDIGVRMNSHPPYFGKKHGSSHNSSGTAAKILQKYKLLWTQIQNFAATGGFTPDKVQFQVQYAQPGGFFARNQVPPQKVA